MSEPQIKPVDYDHPADAQLIHKLDIREYHDHKAISKSQIHDFAYECAKKYEWVWVLGNREEKDHFNFGNAFHCMALEPDDFHDRYTLMPDDWLTKDKHPDNLTIKEQKEQFRAAHEDKVFISTVDFEIMEEMKPAFLAEPTCRVLFPEKGMIEATILWTDPVTGLRLKCRPDYMMPDIDVVVDIKTTGLQKGASKRKFQTQAHQLAYHLSCAMTARGYEAFYGRPLKKYYFAVIEKHAPFCAAGYDADQELFERGGFDMDKYLPRMQNCLELDYWPSYNEQILMLDLPPWAKKELEYGDDNE